MNDDISDVNNWQPIHGEPDGQFYVGGPKDGLRAFLPHTERSSTWMRGHGDCWHLYEAIGDLLLYVGSKPFDP